MVFDRAVRTSRRIVIECIPTAETRRVLYEMNVNCDGQLAEYTRENGFVLRPSQVASFRKYTLFGCTLISLLSLRFVRRAFQFAMISSTATSYRTALLSPPAEFSMSREQSKPKRLRNGSPNLDELSRFLLCVQIEKAFSSPVIRIQTNVPKTR
jgi:hypothetical protein